MNYDREIEMMLNKLGWNQEILNSQEELIEKIEEEIEKETVYKKASMYKLMSRIMATLRVKGVDNTQLKTKYMEIMKNYERNHVPTLKVNVSWEEIVKTANEIKLEKGKWLEEKLIVGLYTLLDDYVFRNDFYKLKITRKEEETANINHNYLLLKDNEFMIIMNTYKTSKQFDTYRILVNNEKLKELLSAYIEKTGEREYLFMSISKKMYMGSSFSHKVKQSFDLIIGYEISINELRKIRETSILQQYSNMTQAERLFEHEKLQHTQSSALKHYAVPNFVLKIRNAN